MDWSGVDYLWIIVMFLSAVWQHILTAPIHCRGSVGTNLFWWRNKQILDGLLAIFFIFGWTISLSLLLVTKWVGSCIFPRMGLTFQPNNNKKKHLKHIFQLTFMLFSKLLFYTKRKCMVIIAVKFSCWKSGFEPGSLFTLNESCTIRPTHFI